MPRQLILSIPPRTATVIQPVTVVQTVGPASRLPITTMINTRLFLKITRKYSRNQSQISINISHKIVSKKVTQAKSSRCNSHRQTTYSQKLQSNRQRQTAKRRRQIWIRERARWAKIFSATATSPRARFRRQSRALMNKCRVNRRAASFTNRFNLNRSQPDFKRLRQLSRVCRAG